MIRGEIFSRGSDQPVLTVNAGFHADLDDCETQNHRKRSLSDWLTTTVVKFVTNSVNLIIILCVQRVETRPYVSDVVSKSEI